MNYSIGECYDFEINQHTDDDNFFHLSIPGYPEATLPKLKFQRSEPLPNTLKCIVKNIGSRGLVLGHYLPGYIKRFYESGAARGEVFEFTVIDLPQTPEEPHILEDDYGMRFRIYRPQQPLLRGKRVNCRFTYIQQNRYAIELTDPSLIIPLLTPAEVLDRIPGSPHIKALALRALPGLSTTAEAMTELAEGRGRWILTALKALMESPADIFTPKAIADHPRLMMGLTTLMRDTALYLLEGSNLLRGADNSHRRALQRDITALIERIHPLQQALDLLAGGDVDDFVKGLIDKLRVAGYLYRPAEQFARLMFVFRARPGLVDTHLRSIFDSIMEWPLSTWTTEPFRSAFVEQFEIYIRSSAAAIARLPEAQTRAQTDLLERVITAIALQLIVGGDSASENLRNNRALLYRYISLLRPTRTDELLQKSINALMGISRRIEFSYDDLRQPAMLMTKASVAPLPLTGDALSVSRSLRLGSVEITASPRSLAIRAVGASPQAAAVVPKSLMPWLSPQVITDNVKTLTASRLTNLEAHRKLWGDIENSLFSHNTAPTADSDSPAVSTRRQAEVGDSVYIVIDSNSVTGNDDPRWRCRIIDSDYLPAGGYISRSDIVSYNIRGNDIHANRLDIDRAFHLDNGRQARFSAVVKSIDASGDYHFSLIEDVDKFIDESLNYNDHYYGVVTSKSQWEYQVLSSDGYGVFLERSRDLTLERGDIVEFRITDKSSPKHIRGTFIDLAAADVIVDKNTAFINLLSSLAFDPGPDAVQAAEPHSAPEEDSSEEGADTLSEEDLRHIIELLRFKALACSRLLEAYDYLMYGRLLALALSDASLADELLVHAALLRLHQYYATNQRIDPQELDQYRGRASRMPLLSIVFHRLEIVSWLGDESRNDTLWTTVREPRNEPEGNLARLVLSFNMIPAENRADSEIARGLKAEIARALGVNSGSEQLRSYGSENQFVEFKSSIVYPARRHPSEAVEADIDRQLKVILRTVAGFLNASGGTLYIGVNDHTHTEVGLFNDFEYFQHRKAYIGKIPFSISSADNMCNFLTNLTRHVFGTTVTESIQITRDEEATRDVIMIKVEPRAVPVELDGDIYVRRSVTTMRVSEQERESFIDERRERFRSAATVSVSAAVVSPETALAESPEPDRSSVPDIPAAAPTCIATSAWRPNALHPDEDLYSHPAGYVYFESGHSLSWSRSDLYREYELPLVLAVSADELSRGFLTLVYPGLKMLRVPLTAIHDITTGQIARFGADGATPLWASIAMPGDGIALYMADARGYMRRRVVKIDEIATERLSDLPTAVADAQGLDTVGAELISADALPQFADSLAANLPSRHTGREMRCRFGTDEALAALAADVVTATPQTLS